jgi:hypothetical protein
MRPMKDADAPIDDPKGKGRTFRRKMSVFGVSGAAAAGAVASAPAHVHSSSCGCGRPQGSCGL